MVPNKTNTDTQGNIVELDDEFFANVKEMLLFVGRSSDPINKQNKMILDKLSDQLFFLRERGFQFSEISLILLRSNIEISADTIKDYYHLAQAKRIKACEVMLSDYYKPTFNATIERTALIERGLRQSLKDGTGLLLHYQPQVDMHTGVVIGAEALVRWMFNGNLIQPGDFIPVAENSGLIVPIGAWALREACREAKRWQELGLGGDQGIKMGVNLSVKQFSDELPDMVHGILCDAELPTNLLGLEITESFLVGNGSLTVLNALRNSGIHLSIDDFGTGYSCLSQLRNLPLETIKIDRAFVQDLGIEGMSSSVVETIIELAKKLGMKTLAEGVENEVQADILKDMGCSVCQGFFYSRPLPGPAFVRFVGWAGESKLPCAYAV